MPRSRFTTYIKKYSIDSEPLVFPIRFGPTELNKTVKNLLKDSGIDTSHVNFNFFINGELLTVPLNEFIESKEISEEIEEIVYDIDFEPPNLENETQTEQYITGMKFQSKWIAAACCDLQIFDITAPEKPAVFIPFDNAMYKVDWISLDEQTNEAVIIGGGEFGKMAMWKCDLANGMSSEIFDYKGHLKNVTSLAVSGDKSLVASGSDDGMLKIWSTSQQVTDLSIETGGIPHISKKKEKVPTRIPIVTLNAHNQDICDIKWLSSSLELSNDVVKSDTPSNSGNLLTCSNDFFLKLWNIKGNETHVVREVKAKSHLRVMDANSVNNLIITGCADNRLRCFDLRAQVAEAHNILKAHNHSITGVQWSGSNCNIFLSTCRRGVTKLWDIRNIKSSLSTMSSFNSSVTCSEWRADGEWLANSYADGSLKFYKFNV